MITIDGEFPGSSGRSWSVPAASSRMIKARRLLRSVRHRVVNCSRSWGMTLLATPRWRSSTVSASRSLGGCPSRE
jgi:hypothetical protein